MTKHTVKVSLASIAKSIDHSLLHPSMTDDKIDEGLRLCRDLKTATACVKPYCITRSKEILGDSGVLICPVIGFPHGNSTTASKVAEAIEAVELGGHEIDMVINVGKALSGEWEYVQNEIKLINEAVVSRGAILKVIFETDFLKDEHIIRLCQICSDIGVAFIKTSTGFGFVQDPKDGKYSYTGATPRLVALMRKHSSPSVRIKASGGVRTLDAWLKVVASGAIRIGTSSTTSILQEAKQRGIGEKEVEVTVELDD
ncbi:deoxyribose-phosphate aldolase [Cystobasidium minutum MCA 4210]|uniref:deoxyribose-phosphate aldolase n=1 Tax=Cystobasidium minutum MCA 4210 TaxID=1397322 RepID=UPI0034CE3343|eukprot:jgi/Rhomi1/12652/CE12651_946